MSQQEQQLQPNALDLASTGKKMIIALASEKALKLEEEGADLIGAMTMAEKIRLWADSFVKESKDLTREEVRRYGKSMRNGVQFSLGKSVENDYSADPVWHRLNALAEEAKARLKNWQNTLNTLPYEGRMMLDEETGEMYKAYPPAKKETEVVKLEIK